MLYYGFMLLFGQHCLRAAPTHKNTRRPSDWRAIIISHWRAPIGAVEVEPFKSTARRPNVEAMDGNLCLLAGRYDLQEDDDGLFVEFPPGPHPRIYATLPTYNEPNNSAPSQPFGAQRLHARSPAKGRRRSRQRLTILTQGTRQAPHSTPRSDPKRAHQREGAGRDHADYLQDPGSEGGAYNQGNRG